MSLREDIDATRAAVARQPGCPVPDCAACQENRRRSEASERVIALALRAERLQAIYDGWVTAARLK